MDRLPVKPRWQILAGFALILLLIAGWAVLVATGAALLEGLPWPVHLLYYATAGIVWIFPVRPLLRWMGNREN